MILPCPFELSHTKGNWENGTVLKASKSTFMRYTIHEKMSNFFRLSQNGYKNCFLLPKLLVGAISSQKTCCRTIFKSLSWVAFFCSSVRKSAPIFAPKLATSFFVVKSWKSNEPFFDRLS